MRRAAFLVVLAGLVLAAPTGADPHLANLHLSFQEGQVQASFDLQEGFDEQLLERIESGLPGGFLFQFRLYRDHRRWFDKRLDSTALRVVATFNAVSREYLVNYLREGELIESRVVHDAKELRRAMTRFETVPLFTLGDLPSDWRLLVRARADLGPRTGFLFTPTRATTEWLRSEKFRAPD